MLTYSLRGMARQALSMATMVLLCIMVPLGVQAEDPAEAKPDIRVLIDVSGSMKRNDPNNLRRPALDLLVKLLPDGSKAGVWTFGEQVNMLIPHQEVSDAWRRQASRSAGQINSVALYTNIGGALEKASYDFLDMKQADNVSFILLTDGMVDIDKNPNKNEQARQDILQQWLPKVVEAGADVHTIALSQNADKRLMERLAMDTDGMAAVAESADDLMKIFLRALDASAPSEQVPIANNQFLIDSSVEEFTALIFKSGTGPATALIGPDQNRYSPDQNQADARWHSTANYDLVTLQRPLEGEWQIQGDIDPDNRVTVVSNLKLSVNRLPKNVFPGSIPELAATMLEDGKVITRGDFLRLVDVSVAVTSADSGKRWRKSLSQSNPVPAGGRFEADLSMLKQAGDYEVSIIVDGKTFERSNKQLISVREPYQIELTEIDDEQGFPMLEIRVTGRDTAVDYDATKAIATIRTPSGRSQFKPLQVGSDRNWVLNYDGLEQPGAYSVNVELIGQYQDGNKLKLKLPGQTHVFGDAGAGNEVLDLAPEPAPEPTQAKQPAPEPAPEPEPEPEAEAEAEQQPEEETGLPDWLLYLGLGVGNLLIVVLGYLAYRAVKGSDKSEVLDDDEEDAEIALDDISDEDSEDNDLSLADVAGSAEESKTDDVAADMDFADEIIEIAPEDDEKT